MTTTTSALSLCKRHFTSFGEALHDVIEQGAHTVEASDLNTFCFERKSQRNPSNSATCLVHRSNSGSGAWIQTPWLIGDNGGAGYELYKDAPNLTVGQAIAKFYFKLKQKNKLADKLFTMILPRTIQTEEDRWQLHLNPVRSAYEVSDGSTLELDDLMLVLSLPPERRNKHIFRPWNIKSWTTDKPSFTWDRGTNLYVTLERSEEYPMYTARITSEGELEIISIFQSGIVTSHDKNMTWELCDRLTVEDANLFPIIYAETASYSVACELGIKAILRNLTLE